MSLALQASMRGCQAFPNKFLIQGIRNEIRFKYLKDVAAKKEANLNDQL